MKRLALMTMIAVWSTGCLKTYVKRSSSLSPDASLPTLVVHAGTHVHQANSSEDTDVAVLVGALQNTQLDTFGESLLDRSTPFLSAQGVELVVDPERAKSHRSRDLGELGNRMTVVTGGWTDPRGSVMPILPRMPFRDAYSAKMAELLHVEGSGREGYLYLVATIYQRGLLLPYPKLALSFVVHDDQGQQLLLAQGVGQGRRSILISNRSPENLFQALDQALQDGAEITVFTSSSTAAYACFPPSDWARVSCFA